MRYDSILPLYQTSICKCLSRWKLEEAWSQKSCSGGPFDIREKHGNYDVLYYSGVPCEEQLSDRLDPHSPICHLLIIEYLLYLLQFFGARVGRDLRDSPNVPIFNSN